jgi:hypothetical protein
MGITAERLAELYPQIYHMAEDGSWDNIRQYGLLSTIALLDLYEIRGEERFAIESQHRPKSVPMDHSRYGPAVIRDQIPMRESSLEKCLVGMAPRQWYELLNGKVFFWATRQRLLKLLSARAYRNRTHSVLTIDTQQLVARYAEALRLSPINSGSTIYKPQRRGAHTFQLMPNYPFDERKKKRGVANAIAEMCVDYSVPDLGNFVIRVVRMKGPTETDTIFER